DADLEAAQAGVAVAQAAVAAAQSNLDQTVVTAPFDGVVGQKLLVPGAFASAQTPIVTLVSPTVEGHLTVEEARLSQLQPRQAVQLTVPAFPGTTFPGHVATIAPVGDPKAHTFDVKILPDNQDGRLLPGMFAQVQVTTASSGDAVLVPVGALVQQ